MNNLGITTFFSLVVIGLTGGWFANHRYSDSIPLGTVSQSPGSSGSLAEEAQEPLANDEKTIPDRTELVKDWARPQVTLFITGSQHGYIEPCGCTGLQNQKGGLMRRCDAQRVLLDRGWNLVSLDAGSQINRVAMQSKLKLQATYQTLTRVMKYDCIGVGVEDLQLSGGELAQSMVDTTDGESPFVVSNIEVLAPGIALPYRIIESGGKRIGVAMVVGDEHFKDIQEPEIKKTPAMQALRQVTAQLLQAKCDALVLVAQTSKENCLTYAKQYPVFDLIVVGECAGEPTLLPEKITGNNRTTQIIEVGAKGMYVGIVGCNWNNGKLELKYERVPLDARFHDVPDAKNVFVSYQKELEQLYSRPENFPDIQPRQTPSGLSYIGSEECAECHQDEYDIWKDGVDGEGGEVGPHSRATIDLIDPKDNPRAEIKRNFDPECLSCHVTGWNPQKFFPYQTGYKDLAKDVALHGNGCENCHGPGKEHVEIENADDADPNKIDELRLKMKRTLKQAKEGMCMECHDADNSPDFEKKGFEEYWKHIRH